MIPLPQLGLEFLLGISAALALGNAWALLRPWWIRRRTGKRVPTPPSPRRVWTNIAIGTVVALWSLATMLSH